MPQSSLCHFFQVMEKLMHQFHNQHQALKVILQPLLQTEHRPPVAMSSLNLPLINKLENARTVEHECPETLINIIHKQKSYIASTLAHYVELVDIIPETPAITSVDHDRGAQLVNKFNPMSSFSYYIYKNILL